MNQIYNSLVIPFLYAMLFGIIIYPLLITLSKRLKYTDKPNNRKVHKTPIPIVGGIGISVLVGLAIIILPTIRSFAMNHSAVLMSLGALAITGIIDDKICLPATLKLIIQIICSYIVADSGIRITSFHGLFGVKNISVELQYLITVLLIAGITNAVNLLDGIDGLVGLFSIINIAVLGAFALLLQEFSWLSLFSVVLGALIVFIKYNWMPAKMFMGDTGSLFLGFLMSVGSIYLLNKSITFKANTEIQYMLPVVLIGCFAIPVIDTLRVFLARMQKGRSPFSPDKTHLHHKIIKLINQHHTATLKIIGLHVVLVALAFTTKLFMKISEISIMFLIIIILFTLMLNFVNNFTTWYKKIRKIEGGLDSYIVI
jgi:UDP-GlcNAc:undecaprenyl-phosphate/decaprenyl-phosphate GlcNAc-1-phosphate transferase